MNILLISQCQKRALTQTRRILDQFAERRGERTWQTPITQEGLNTLRRLLKKTARKNTAVACHWIRGIDHSELLWIVGDARQFNSQGAVPTNRTRSNVLRSQDENDWLHGEDIQLMAGLAALLHDLGKACHAFQQRLRGNGVDRFKTNLYRHEWVSLRLFQVFVGKDDDATWLARLQNPAELDSKHWLALLEQANLRDGLDPEAAQNKPFGKTGLPPLAAAIGWLVVTHHRLPVMPEGEEFNQDHLTRFPEQLDARWNQMPGESTDREIKPYWQFKQGLPVDDPTWRKQVIKLAGRLAARLRAGPVDWLRTQPYVMHVSRLALMLADHYFSSQQVEVRWQPEREGKITFANTLQDGPDGRRFNQMLDEHLVGVAKHSAAICHALPGFEQSLGWLARHKGLQGRSKDSRFGWQDKAAEQAAAMRERSQQQGAFIINMASTGCGRTLGNAKVMYALANPQQGMRCAFAMGLRTLTLQTAQVFRRTLKLDEEDLAIRVGGAANTALFEYHQRQAESSGSESQQALVEEDEANHVHYEGALDQHPLLNRLTGDNRLKAMLAASVLVCTVDHLMPATESTRGGRQIVPMLRLMSGDVVLDEIDDFDVSDLPALTRLVYWAGLLGSCVLLSSATLPPALIQGLFDAYLAGRKGYQQSRGQPGLVANVCCLWLDENDRQQADCATQEAFAAAHQQFANQRYQWLATQPARRTATLLPISSLPKDSKTFYPALANLLRDTAVELHRDNAEADPASGKRVSLGLIRIANISRLYPLARALYALGPPEGVRIHLCVYHSQYPLLLRSAIERQLDTVLDRTKPEQLFQLADIRQRLDGTPEPEQLFIVLGSPVTEVGRDHDYSWAIAEPSSMRSLIQLAGRVRRHRPEPYDKVNVRILEQNIKSWLEPGKPAYLRPGFEQETHDSDYRLEKHGLSQLLQPDEYRYLDARPRLLAREAGKLQPKHSLVDLEHGRLQWEVNGAWGKPRPQGRLANAISATAETGYVAARACWAQPTAMLSGLLQRDRPFRADPNYDKKVQLLFLPNEDEDGVRLMKRREDKHGEVKEVEVEEQQHHRISNDELYGQGQRLQSWANVDYLEELLRLAEEQGMSPEHCARKFGWVELDDVLRGWYFHSALGFGKAEG